MSHVPVLLSEVLAGLEIKPDGIYVDGTFGRGGHSQAILSALGEGGRLLVLDRDPEAIAAAREIKDTRLHVFQACFSELKNIVEGEHLLGAIDGVLLDLGVSSPQLDTAERGFSFMNDGPLDMRMDPSQGVSAREWLAHVNEKTLADVLFSYGDERYSRRIARAIVDARKTEALISTHAFAAIIAKAHPKWEPHKHPATKSFQAIRIFINRELEELKACLSQCEAVLKVGGRVAVISFHSLEDRIVKHWGKSSEELPRYLPRPTDAPQTKPRLKRIGKPIQADETEIQTNTRSRSAILRLLEKIQ